MAYQVHYTEEVLADLEEVTGYAETHFPGGAEHFFPGLLDQIELLGIYPRMGSIHQASSQARKILYTPFVIYYRIFEPQQRIDILHIWHGSRRPPTL
jgi:plasmid stabilization system protein ParE